jgi:hypothetical protein
MSFNLLKNVDPRIFVKYIGKPLVVQEKFDTCDFWARISENNVSLLNKGRELTEVDYFLNSLYNDVEVMLESYLTDYDRKKLVEKYGEFDLHIFYFPSDKPRHTEYPNMNKHIVLSDIWFKDPKALKLGHKFMILEDVAKVMNLETATLNVIEVTHGVAVAVFNYINEEEYWSLQETCEYFIDRDHNCFKLCREFTSDRHTFNGDISKTYGIILKLDSHVWQIPINEYKRLPYDSMHTQYRDIILHDFVSEMLIDNPVFIDSVKRVYKNAKDAGLNPNRCYFTAMEYSFLQYINRTDVFKKYRIEPTDLMPVHYGYTSDIMFTMITDEPTIYMICKHNALMKEVLRLLVYTFYNINHKTFHIFNEFETRAISKFLLIFS